MELTRVNLPSPFGPKGNSTGRSEDMPLEQFMS